MRHKLRLALVAVAAIVGRADAQRFAERTPPPRVPAVAPAWPADGLPPLARFVRPSTVPWSTPRLVRFTRPLPSRSPAFRFLPRRATPSPPTR